jgi:hypothetical protein
MADRGLGPPSDQRITFVFKFPQLSGMKFSRLNWDEISEVFQRTPNPRLKLCIEEVTAGTDTRETSSYLGFHQSLLLL